MKTKRLGQAPLVRLSGVTIKAAGGRTLFADLNLVFGRERVAIVGRNGVGKSSLLDVIASERAPYAGSVEVRSRSVYVRQILTSPRSAISALEEALGSGLATEKLEHELQTLALPPWNGLRNATLLSSGENRKLHLAAAKLIDPELLLLDEPTEDLDDRAIFWLRAWLTRRKGVIVASHDSRLLADFHDFFIAAESGGRYYSGSYEAAVRVLDEEREASARRYASSIAILEACEEDITQIARRRARKRRSGRVRELKRATPRQRLNQKRDYAQVKHGRMARIRALRRAAARARVRSSRRELRVELPLEPGVSVIGATDSRIVAALKNVSASAGERMLFRGLTIDVSSERIGVRGPNGSGKTTLLEILAGVRPPATGTVTLHSVPGFVQQGGANWMLRESLAELLEAEWPGHDIDGFLSAHRFPRALAARPLRSLSPGERTRAALLLLFNRRTPVEILILDEPTFSLDQTGREGMMYAIRGWNRALVVASHEIEFLESLELDCTIDLARCRMVEVQ